MVIQTPIKHFHERQLLAKQVFFSSWEGWEKVIFALIAVMAGTMPPLPFKVLKQK
jgi:hypothetical protein